jgi:methionyl-tRNA formyltransferase
MKVIILTTSPFGTAGHHLPVLLQAKGVEVQAVVLSEGQVVSTKKKYSRLLKKVMKIGVLGAYNGVKMRKWYNEDVAQYTTISSAEDICRQNNIPFYRVPHTNSKETQELFASLAPDLGLSLGNGYISSKVFTIPRFGMINIHHEVLPDYQNAQSIIWQIYNGSRETGYTIHRIDKGIDTGNILLIEKVPILFKETLGETVAATMAALLNKSATGLKSVLEGFESYLAKAVPQGHGTKYTTPSYSQYRRILRQFDRLRKG